MVQAWVSAIDRAREWTQQATPAEVARTLEPDFPGISLDDLTAAVDRYQGLGVWAGPSALSETAFASVRSLLVDGGILKSGDSVGYSDVVLRPDQAAGATSKDR